MADSDRAEGRVARQALTALPLLALATGVGMLLGEALGPANTAFLYLLPVILLAQRWGLWPGLATAALATLAFNYFFVPPVFTLRVAGPDNLVTLAIFGITAAAVSSIAGRLREQALRARRMAAENAELATLSQQFSRLADQAEIRGLLTERLGAWIHGAVRLLAPADLDAARSAMAPLDQAAARWTLEHGEVTGKGTALMAGADACYFPVRIGTEDSLIASFWRGDAAPPVGPGDVDFIGQALARGGDALHRAGLAARQSAIEARRQQEAMREALLASISHDLRTPLTAIRAGLDAIGNGHADALDETRDAADRLDRMVGNLLDLARLQAEGAIAEQLPLDLTDIVDAAIRDLRQPLAGHPLDVQMDGDLPLVRADARMLHHMLVNLIDNAVKYGGLSAPILIRAESREGGVVLGVLDRGAGLPAEGSRDLFALFQRGSNADSQPGNGLGLAVVDGFARAMGLRVSATGRAGGGSAFEIHFPKERLVAARSDHG